jgi:hypothetical protein
MWLAIFPLAGLVIGLLLFFFPRWFGKKNAVNHEEIDDEP